MIRLIVAMDKRRGIAKNSGQPWKLTEDEAYFTNQTKTHGGNILVGSTTFRTFKDSLVDRHNYVLTHNNEPIPGATLVHDLNQFLIDFNDKDVWVVGGAAIYDEVIKAGRADELYITHIDADLNCDQFFPNYLDQFKLVEQSPPHHQNGLSYNFAIYRNVK